jgi:hypothetical protein
VRGGLGRTSRACRQRPEGAGAGPVGWSQRPGPTYHGPFSGPAPRYHGPPGPCPVAPVVPAWAVGSASGITAIRVAGSYRRRRPGATGGHRGARGCAREAAHGPGERVSDPRLGRAGSQFPGPGRERAGSSPADGVRASLPAPSPAPSPQGRCRGRALQGRCRGVGRGGRRARRRLKGGPTGWGERR